MLTLNSGFWIGFLLMGISNWVDPRDFDDRDLLSRFLSSMGTLLVAACASLAIILTGLTLLAGLASLIAN